MKKFQWLSILPVVLALCACFGSWDGDEGILTLSLGSAARYIDYYNDNTSEYNYRVTLEGPGGTIQERLAGGTHVIRVIPGKWDLTIKAYGLNGIADKAGPEVLRAMGTKTITVKSGKNPPEIITMYSASEVSSYAEFDEVLRMTSDSPDKEEIIILKNNIPTEDEINNPIDEFTQYPRFEPFYINKKITLIAEETVSIFSNIFSPDHHADGNIFYASFFNVGPNGCLVLGKEGMKGTLAVDGTGQYPDTIFVPIITVEADGELVMNNNVTLKSNTGGAVMISADGSSASQLMSGSGTFIMNGGTISGNNSEAGGGVFNFGTFIMNGGTISGNEAYTGGGIYNIGSLELNGGKIILNKADSGGGIFSLTKFNPGGISFSENIPEDWVINESNEDITFYAISADSIGPGTIEVRPEAQEGETVTIYLAPEPDCRVKSVDVSIISSGTPVEVSGSGVIYTFVMPASAVSVSAAFEADLLRVFSITIDLPLGGGTCDSGVTEAAPGVTVTLTLSPDAGYSIETVSVTRDDNGQQIDGAGNGNSRTFVMPASNVTVNVVFALSFYVITRVAPPNGSFDVPASAQEGETVTISAITPDAGYSIENVSVTRNDNDQQITTAGNGNSRTFVMPASDVTVNIVFALSSYAITGTAPLNGSFDVPAYAKEGETVDISIITPAEGYSIGTVSVTREDTGVSLTVDGFGNWRTFAMPASGVNVSVEFVKERYVISNNSVSPEQGSFYIEVNGLNSQTQAAFDDEVTVKVTASSGYRVASVTVDLVVVEKISETEYRFKMPARDIVVSVLYEQIDLLHTISVTPPAAGDNKVTVSLDTARAGETITITVEPSAGYQIGGLPTVTGDGDVPVQVETVDSKIFTFIMPDSDVTVLVDFIAG